MGLPAYQDGITKRTLELFSDEHIAHFAKMKPAREVTFLMNCLVGLIVSVNENKSLGADKIDEALLSLIPNDKIGFLLPNAQKSIQINVKEAVLFKEIDFKVENEVKDDFGRQYTIWHHDALTSRNKNWLLTKLRNGIAHQHIKAINTPDNTKWTGIKLWNVAKSYHCSGNYKDFEITLTIEQLTKLARHIAQSVLPIS